MQGRLYLALAMLSLAGLLPSLAWACAILFGAPVPDLRWQFAVFLLPLLICTLAMYPRDEAERLLMASGIGLHPSNRRRALTACFRPYRPRPLRLRNFRIRSMRRLLAMEIPLLLLFVATNLILPFAFLGSFAIALRRSAWLGNAIAREFEKAWLDVYGPVRTP